MNDTRQHKERMAAAMAALAEGDRRPFGELLAEDFTWVITGHGAWSGRYEGRQAVRERLMQPLFAQFAGTYTNRAHRIVADGDIVVVECRGSVATTRGERYDNEYCYVCRFGADGLLHELVEYLDTELVAKVLAPPA